MAIREEVLEGLCSFPVGTRRAHRRVEREQRALEVAARRIRAVRGTEVPADGGLAANLVVRQVLGAGGQGRHVIGEAEQFVDASRGADRDLLSVDADPVEVGLRQQEHAGGIEPAVRDLGHDDCAAADHRRSGTVAEERDGFGLGRRDEYLRSHLDPFSLASRSRLLLAGDAPVLGVDSLDHDLDVVRRGAARLGERIRQRLDHLRHGLLGDAAVVQLDLDHRHDVASFGSAGPAAGTVQRGIGAV